MEFVDDSLSTNVLPALAALEAFGGRPVALLVGGRDRGLDYAPLARSLCERTTASLVVTMPDNGPRIGDAVRHEVRRAGGSAVPTVVDVASLEAGVETAFAWAASAGPDAVVLLSPAAPSFGRFTDYPARAAAFAAAARTCGPLD